MRLLRDVRRGTERTTKVFQEISQVAIAATTLALSLTALVSMAGDGHLGPVAHVFCVQSGCAECRSSLAGSIRG